MASWEDSPNDWREDWQHDRKRFTRDLLTTLVLTGAILLVLALVMVVR